MEGSGKPAASSDVRRYPRLGARIWHGMTLGAVLALIRAGGIGKIGIGSWPMLASMFVTGGMNSVLAAIQRRRYGARIAATEIETPPLFILGHWRSGTTLLHELLALDRQHRAPTTFECMAPAWCLVAGFVRKLDFMVPAKRPMDDMDFGWDRPQEDEFALLNLGLPSVYRQVAFPNDPPANRALTSAEMSEPEQRRFVDSLRSFAKLVAMRSPGKRLVLKSPPHLGRVRLLLEAFPDARFVHIVRDPQKVFPSTVKLNRLLAEIHALQPPDFSRLEEDVLSAFEQMYGAFEKERALIPEGRLYELRYEDLVADPQREMRKLYRQLDLGDFDRAAARVRTYFQDRTRYRTNTHSLDERTRETIERRWGRFMRPYGYGQGDAAGGEREQPRPSSDRSSAGAGRCPVAHLLPPKPEASPPIHNVHSVIPMRIRLLLRARHSWFSLLSPRSYRNFVEHVSTPFQKLYFLNHPDEVDRVLIKEQPRFPKSAWLGSTLSMILGNGIFVSNGEDWRKQRRMIDPAFGQARIQDVFPLMRDAADDMEARLDRLTDGAILDVDEEMAHVTADIIFRTIFSRALSRDEAMAIFRAFGRLQEILVRQGIWNLAGIPRTLLPGRLTAIPHARVIRGILDREVRRRLVEEERGSANGERKDIISSLLKAKDPVSGDTFGRKELIDQISLMFLAGHETSATALSFALYLIAMRPDIQERMHEEAVVAFGEGRAEFSHTRHLRLTRDVFRETLRLYPTLPLLGRDALDPQQIKDKQVDAGMLAFISPWLIHRHERLWERPDEFDPDRFSRAEEKESIRNAYLPFGAGPRVCIGASFATQEGVLILATLARRFRFELVEGEVPVPIARLTLRSENGVKLRVLKRNASLPVIPGSGA